MKNLIKSLTLFAVCFFFYNTATAQVTFDYDKDADFTQYKTYSFGGWQEGSDKLVNDLDKKRIQQSFKSEFTMRNMDYVLGDADVIVTLYLVIDEKTSTTAYTDYHGMGMGYGYAGYYRPAWGWGGGYATTTYSEDDYRVGTLVVDVYDAKSKKLVWQGVSQKTINENASKRAKTIPKGVKKIMKNYPVEVSK
jgi:putative salt-induced outer membrane protein YdiY